MDTARQLASQPVREPGLWGAWGSTVGLTAGRGRLRAGGAASLFGEEKAHGHTFRAEGPRAELQPGPRPQA